MLANLYVMQEKLDTALALLDEEPEAKLNVKTMRANILLRKGELNMRRSGLSAAYLAKHIRAALEESEELAPLRERADFRALLARLAETEKE